MGENGHVDVQSLAPNYEDVGLKYRWEISNLNNSNNANLKITTFDNKEVLGDININPNDVILVDTLVEKGDTINVHTMQGDGTYVSKTVSVDENMIKFKDVDVKNIDVLIVPAVAYDKNCYRLGGLYMYDFIVDLIGELPTEFTFIYIIITF